MRIPDQFEKLLNQALPADEVAPLLDSLEWAPLTSVRLNKAKACCLKENIPATEIPWDRDVKILQERPLFAADPAFHAGGYYVQESSSTIIGAVVKVLISQLESEARVLDLCAAPGGKSTHITSVLRFGDILVANEVIKSRVGILNENLIKWGRGNHIVTSADAKEFSHLTENFDIVLADMPCSGEGMFRKDPKSCDEWSENNVELCALRQKRIAQDIWPALKPGGFMIYSTCTYNKTENEDNIQFLCKELDAKVIDDLIPSDWGLYSNLPGMYRLMPHRHPGEGLFFAVLQKTGSENLIVPKQNKINRFKEIVIDSFNLPFYQSGKNETLFYFKGMNEDQYHFMNQLPGIFAAGTPAGKLFEKKNGTQFKPDVGICLLARTEIPYENLNFDDSQIMKYLMRENIANNGGLKGLYSVSWHGIRLGFMNGTGSQWNNLWPMDWRLRKPIDLAAGIVEIKNPT